jgi:glutathionylspermidine synthase
VERRAITPREGWRAKVEQQGLVFWQTTAPDGTTFSYWDEEHLYAVSAEEVYEWEATARVLMEQLVEAGDFVIEHDLWDRFGIPGLAVDRIRETWEREPPMLYGRFDFALAPDGQLRLLELNADTPTCLVEAAAVQWHWLQDRFGEGGDQWNRVHEALVERWTELRTDHRLPDGHVHVLHTSAERSGEDFVTAAYLMETARQAGLRATLLPIEQLTLHETAGFLGMDGELVRSAFKLYPWEWMVREPWAVAAMERMGAGMGETQWIEPVWKMLWSTKAILPVLWHLFPGHPNLLPAFFEDDGRPVDPLGAPVDVRWERGYVRKPLLAREGADLQVVLDGAVVEAGPAQGYGAEGFVLQQFCDLGTYDGAHPVLGVWVVDMEPQGLGIRESDGLVTTDQSRFVPHAIV